MNAGKLHQKLEKIAPVVSVSIGDANDKSTWKIEYKDAPSAEQVALINSMIASYVPLTPEQIQANLEHESYLMSTDKDVALYVEQISAGLKTNLSAEEFKDLASSRELARQSIVGE